MASKYGSIPLTDEELRTIIHSLEYRKQILRKRLKEFQHIPNASKNVIESSEALIKINVLLDKFIKLRYTAKLD